MLVKWVWKHESSVNMVNIFLNKWLSGNLIKIIIIFLNCVNYEYVSIIWNSICLISIYQSESWLVLVKIPHI